MTAPDLNEDHEISLFALGATLLRNRWRIVRWMVVGGLAAALSVISAPSLFRASASFIPQGNDSGRSGLASLARPFGISLATGGGESNSPEFYSDLLRSRVVLSQIARDTLTVDELGGRRIPFADLFKIQGSAVSREEQGVKLLKDMVNVSSVPTTGVVQLSIATQWRSVSLQIVNDLLRGLNDYNERTRQSQASAERHFVEGRVAVADSNLRASEDRMESFLKSNHDIGHSAELSIERDRIQRDVAFRQQLVASLTQEFEEARIREVRDTPVITVFEPPAVPLQPEPRGRLKRILLGVVLAGLLATLVVLTTDAMRRRRREGAADVVEFVAATKEATSGILRYVPWRRSRIAP
jgi:uncharacterized protein involved in exopolysaccharide biosynthesis